MFLPHCEMIACLLWTLFVVTVSVFTDHLLIQSCELYESMNEQNGRRANEPKSTLTFPECMNLWMNKWSQSQMNQNQLWHSPSVWIYEWTNDHRLSQWTKINSNFPKCMNLWMNKRSSFEPVNQNQLWPSKVYESMNDRKVAEPMNQNQLWPSQVYESMNEWMVAEPMNQINSDLRILNWDDGTQFGGSLEPAPPLTFFFWGPQDN
jgi:hypothetical protein